MEIFTWSCHTFTRLFITILRNNHFYLTKTKQEQAELGINRNMIALISINTEMK